MAQREPATALIVMGVAGSGKTTVAAELASRLGWRFAEADDFHSAANRAKMTTGIPLTDEDRAPWLASIRDWITDQQQADPTDLVLTCSALRYAYRQTLSEAEARVRFLHLHGPRELLEQRIGQRSGHFMPASMLDSQLATLEPLRPDEDGAVVSIDGTTAEIVERALRALSLEQRQGP